MFKTLFLFPDSFRYIELFSVFFVKPQTKQVLKSASKRFVGEYCPILSGEIFDIPKSMYFSVFPKSQRIISSHLVDFCPHDIIRKRLLNSKLFL